MSARVGNVDLRKCNEKSQIRTATRAQAAAVHASVPDLDVRTAEVVGCAHIKERVSQFDALELQACRKMKIFDARRRCSPSHSQSSCRSSRQHAAWLPIIMATLNPTRVRPPASLDALVCTLHVLTDVRSRRALRMWSASEILRRSAADCSGTQLSSAL